MGLGTDDGRNGGSVGDGPGEVPAAERAKAGNEGGARAGWSDDHQMPETENGFLTTTAYASVEVLEEGAKAIGWDKRNPVPGGNPGRFKRGFGVAMSQHHAGRVGYQEGEPGYDWVRGEK